MTAGQEKVPARAAPGVSSQAARPAAGHAGPVPEESRMAGSRAGVSRPAGPAAGERLAGGKPAKGKVWFVGAGPGAAALLTLRGAAATAAADVVIWASSLVHPDVLRHAAAGAEIVDSAALPMEGVLPWYERAARERLRVARVHSGDPTLWGAVQEQLDRCGELGLDTEIVPGVSSFTAAAARIGRELTIPETAQSVILTRLGGGKTPMPPGERVADFARHGTTMALFLSAARSGQLAGELLSGGYPPDTPCVIAFRVSWPDELIVRCPLEQLAATMRAHRLWKHTLVLVGPALAAGGTRSHLYHPGHFHGFRKADARARHVLRDADSRLPGARRAARAVPSSPVTDRAGREARRDAGQRDGEAP
jgi:precorrin-4 C11-methyltransferase